MSLACAACASVPRPLPRARFDSGPVAARVDWDAAGAAAVRDLQGYLRVDTTNPPGNELAGVRYLAGLLSSEGIASEVTEIAPGRASLIARLKGAGEDKPLCLLSHVDVATSEAAKWPADRQPFSGAVVDGSVWGRGALDMKGMGLIELHTLVWLARLGVPLRRDVILVAVPDEEVDNLGAQALAKRWADLGCSQLVNEGGLGLKDLLFPGQTVFAISTGEKGLAWVKLHAHGDAGHGSTPVPGRAPERLLRAIDRILHRPNDPAPQPALYQLLASAGAQAGGVDGFVLQRPLLVRLLAMGKLTASPPVLASMTNTVQVTGFSGMLQPNVVPTEVIAQLDCRLLPGVTPEQFIAELARVVDDPQVTFELVEGHEAGASPQDDSLYQALARHAVEGREDAVAGPVLSPGYTDSLLLRPLGVHAYGFVPFEVSLEEAATMHGTGERVPVESVKRGLRVLFESVVEVSAQ